MRTSPLYAAVAVSCALLTASCVQGPAEVSETYGEGPAAIETKDDGDPFGGDPDLGAGIGSEPPASTVGSGPPSTSAGSSTGGSAAEPEGRFAYKVCVLLEGSSELVRVAFCNSQPDRLVRGRCFCHLKDSPVSWQNWCYNEFSE
jgi:hypothetical protein